MTLEQFVGKLRPRLANPNVIALEGNIIYIFTNDWAGGPDAAARQDSGAPYAGLACGAFDFSYLPPPRSFLEFSAFPPRTPIPEFQPSNL